MILDGMHFTYGEDFDSRTYDLVFAHADTDLFMKSIGTIASNTIYNRRNHKRYLVGNDYKDYPVSMEVEIITEDAVPLAREDKRVVEKALFDANQYMKLFISMDDDDLSETYEYVDGELKRYYFNCRFINPERIEDGRGLVVGYKCEMECDTGMLTQEETSITVSPDSNNQFTISLNTDSKDYVYPRLSVLYTNVADTDTSLVIINTSDVNSRITKIKNNQVATSESTTMTMDSELNTLLINNSDAYSNLSSPYFVRLVDGDNVISCYLQDDEGTTTPIMSASFTWNNKRFI